jgi:hypothetical protein
MGNTNPVRRLDRTEFASALRKGQGRAMLPVIHFGLDDVKDLVLEACIHNQVYDQQIESGRGDWLFEMFRIHLITLNFAKQSSMLLKSRPILDVYFNYAGLPDK